MKTNVQRGQRIQQETVGKGQMCFLFHSVINATTAREWQPYQKNASQKHKDKRRRGN